METVCALSVIDDKRGTSGRKMADFMMDGVCFKGLCIFFGTVRQVFVRFSDGWSRKGKVQEYNINLAVKFEFTDALLYKISFFMSEAPAVAPGAIVIVALPV